MPPSLANPLTIVAVVPLYNGAQYIAAALDSILAQTRPVDDIVVVDDGSKDDGPAIVARYAETHPVRLLTKPNGGQSSARNLGIRSSSCSHIALLDQDDLWYPTHVEELEKAFVRSKVHRLGWVYSNLDEVDESGLLVMARMLDELPAQHPKKSVFQCIREDMFVLPSASLISREAFDVVGGFDERLSGYEDDDFFLRVFRNNFGNEYLNMPLSKWRIHTSSTSYSPLMSQSRLIYADKLFQSFPDDSVRHRFFARDLVAPRFTRTLLGQYVRCLKSGDRKSLHATLDSFLETIVPRLEWRRRLFFRCAALPMRSPFIGRLMLQLAPHLGFGRLQMLRHLI